jgi:hypothetical protein
LPSESVSRPGLGMPEPHKPPSACHSKRLLLPAPEILPEALPTEGAARIALPIVIGAGVAALLCPF